MAGRPKSCVATNYANGHLTGEGEEVREGQASSSEGWQGLLAKAKSY